MSDRPHEQYRPQEMSRAPQVLTWQPTASDYSNTFISSTALDLKGQANSNLIGLGLLTDLHFDFGAKEQPQKLAYNPAGPA